MRYIIVIGSIISGIGKGITSASIGLLLQSMGHVVTMIKIDPYLNVDAGLLSPYEHGECFVLSDGGECDLDLGNYERSLDIELTHEHNITTGRIYQSVIEKERRGDYLGVTVQIVPHITDEIISHISRVSKIPVNGNSPDICIIEVGGTVGDIEALPFIEALQQMKSQTSDDEFCFVQVTMAISNPELKTKPIQHNIAILRSRGISPDILVIRAKEEIPKEIKQKLHRLCQIKESNIISNHDVPTIYHVSEIFNEQNIVRCISDKLNLEYITDPYIMSNKDDIIWHHRRLNILPKIIIGIVGKYTNISKSPDTYLSLVRAIEHASFHNDIHVNVEFIDSETVDTGELSHYNGFIIPGGFGSRGIEGKLLIAKYAREHRVPILGICLGMQIMAVDCFNNAYLDRKGYSSEWCDQTFNDNIEYIINILPDQTGIKGGTMRLGNYTTKLIESKVKGLYCSDTIVERHRHRYEVNNKYISDIEDTGFHFVGKSKSENGSDLMEIAELENHPFYIGCQYHPEFKSRPMRPHPLFIGLLKACQ